jgi:hypothetical protein
MAKRIFSSTNAKFNVQTPVEPLRILHGEPEPATKSLTARKTPRSVVYRNHHARKVAAGKHAPDYATRDEGNFEVEVWEFTFASALGGLTEDFSND